MKKITAILCAVIMILGISSSVFAAEDTTATESNLNQQNLLYEFILKVSGPNKVPLINEVRALTGLGLKEAKDLVEGAPKTIASALSKDIAELYKARFEALGATVELRSYPAQDTDRNSVFDSSKSSSKQILYDVFVKTVVKEAIPQTQASNIEAALLAEGLDAKVEVSSSALLHEADDFEALLRSKLSEQTIETELASYDVVLLTLIEKDVNEYTAAQIKSKLEGLGIEVELKDHIYTPSTPSPVENKAAYDVVLLAAGEKKIQLIKVLREQLGLDLKEAKDIVDNAPYTIKYGVPKEDAEMLKAKLEEQGATVELR